MTEGTLAIGEDAADATPGIKIPEMRLEPALISEPPKAPTAHPAGTYQEDRVRIVLEKNDDVGPTGQFIQVNGRGYMLRANLAADVPLEVVEVLNNAVMATPDVDPLTLQVVGFSPRLRFPYRILAHIPAGTPIQKSQQGA